MCRLTHGGGAVGRSDWRAHQVGGIDRQNRVGTGDRTRRVGNDDGIFADVRPGHAGNGIISAIGPGNHGAIFEPLVPWRRQGAAAFDGVQINRGPKFTNTLPGCCEIHGGTITLRVK